MKKTKFDLFLEQAKIDDTIKNQVILQHVVVDKDNKTWTFHLLFQNEITWPILEQFFRQVQSFFYKPSIVNDILIQPQFEKTITNQSIAESYYKYAIELLEKQNGQYTALKAFDCHYENQVFYIKIDRDSTFIERYFNDIKTQLSRMGMNHCQIQYQIKEDLKPISKVIDEDIQTQYAHLEEKKKLAKPAVEPVKKRFDQKMKATLVPIAEIPLDQYRLDKYKYERGDVNFSVVGDVGKVEFKNLSTGSVLLTFSIEDDSDAILVKRFLKTNKDKEISDNIKVGSYLKVDGYAKYDTYQKTVTLEANAITFLEKSAKELRTDKAKEKRVEFHIHTKMSNMDAITSAEAYINRAIEFGHDAIAFTDHNGVYAFPEIHNKTKGKPIKPIYGAELDFVDDEAFYITSIAQENIDLKDATYVVFDLETTGFSVTRDEIIEIGAVKMHQGQIIDQFQTFVKPQQFIADYITDITSITNEMVHDAQGIEIILPQFLAFTKGCVLVAHNALFDISHLENNARKLNVAYHQPYVIDSLNLARYFYAHKMKRFSLKALTKFFKVKNEQAHRAIHDAKATSEIWIQMLDDLSKQDIKTYFDINQSIQKDEVYKHPIPRHINVIAKNQIGYKNLFMLISDAQTTHFHNGTRALKSVISKYREGLIISSGCVNGEVFNAALNLSDDALEKSMIFYDVIEVQPPNAYQHLEKELGEGYKTIIEGVIAKIIMAAKRLGKIIIASGDVHYLDKEDQKYRDIYIHAPLVGGGVHPLLKYPKKPEVYFLTTKEMLEAFSFLDDDLAYEIVVTNTRKLSETIDHIDAFPKELYSIPNDAYKEVLGIESIEDTVRQLVYQKMYEWYGKEVSPIVLKRVEFELSTIIKNKFAPIYYTSHLLVKKSLEDGYLVGSRGSVGSSFVATLLEITEVNPLKPHYRCPKGDFTVFKMSKEDIDLYGGITKEQEAFQAYFAHAQTGFDLPDQVCPFCQEKLIKDGVDIPFETFLGFKGDKVPDIDLNFSGEYQAKAHEYVRTLLGESYTYRAGTIQTVAERNAYGYVKGYLEDLGVELRPAQIERLARKIEGVKRSSGQHPGGIVVVPKNKTIFDVTPIQYPADNTESAWKTTHFDYHSFESNLLKLDILGHDDPTMIKFLMDYVVDHENEFPFKKAQDIPLDDPKVYALFSGTSVIGVKPDDILSEVASYGVPELGTKFVRTMLQDTKPKTFAGLVKVSGLSHGTDVWLKNARDLVMNNTEFGKIEFDQIIGCRDDIMVQLIDFGMEPLMAFEIMEFVRKGKPSKEKKKWLDYEKEMRKHHVPEWYIWSASRIQYMFPKAHAAAYVTMGIRIAWFKVHKPLLFYSAFFSKRAVQFDYEAMMAGGTALYNKLKNLNEGYNLSAKDEQLQVTVGVALEMVKRGYKFLKVDIMRSEASTFVMEENGLRMPFSSIDGLGVSVANDIVSARHQKAFTSKLDVKERTRINKTVYEKMLSFGAFDDLEDESNEINDGLFA